jgi:large subunit ribosomal protein L29
MKQSQIKDLTLTELHDLIKEETQVLSKLVFNHTVASIENPMKIRQTRRDIARMKTELGKRELLSKASNN